MGSRTQPVCPTRLICASSTCAHYLEIPVTDLASGRSIRVADDPMRWSDLLAETIGYGDIEVAVEDSVKVTFDQPSFEPDIVATEALSALVHER